jgi:transcriptional regulator with XRE-family HTH domain
MADRTDLGELLERAREGLGLSVREAAKRAQISEGRWRQVAKGAQRIGDQDIPVNPRRGTVISMARAVGVAENEALHAAGFDAAEHELLESFERPTPRQLKPPADPIEALIQEIFDDARIPEDRKQELVRGLRRAEAERQAVQDEISRWRRAG